MQIRIDGRKVRAKEGENLFELLKRRRKDIPHLCYDKELSKQSAACRMCLVKINGKIRTACTAKVEKGMKVITNSKELEKLRKMNLKFIIESNKPEDYDSLKMRKLLKRYKIRKGFNLRRRFGKKTSKALVLDEKKCIQCDDCVEVCKNLQRVCALDMKYDAIHTEVMHLKNVCTYCGQCILHCPTGALMERDETDKFLDAKRRGKILIAQTAPSVRAALGELFGYKPGTNVQGKMVAALKKVGFDKVFDVNLGADFTTTEEGNEFLRRLKKRDNMPMFTSCCPAWVKMVEDCHHDFISHLSTSKSPHMMLGKIIKTYYAQKIGVKPSDIYLVSIMPCIAKKFEISRPEFHGVHNGKKYRDVDLVLTTRELARLIKQKRVRFRKLKPAKFDDPLGLAAGGGAIFGVTGGVMESSLRVIYKKDLCNKRIFKEVRGFEGIKTAKLKTCNRTLRVAVVHNLSDAKEIMERIEKGEKFDFVEVMACPGGCIGGGGQPVPSTREIVEQRARAIYNIDRSKKLKVSSENPVMKKVYKEFLGEPIGKKAEELLHTGYRKRKI